jgi:iron complex transport system ATP-binding protein
VTGAPLIEIRDADVVRDGRTILYVDDLTFREGEHVAVLGPNGAGKSTLVGLITRDVLPLTREVAPVLLRGQARWDLFAARRVFGVVSDTLQDHYRRDVTVADVVISGFFGSIGLYRRDEVTTSMAERAEALLDFLDIAHLAGRTMRTLSTGEARRALIGRALVHEPALLVLDEPTHGLDPAGTYRFLTTLRKIADAGCALVIITHHVSDIVPEVTRVVMLKDGRVFRDGEKHALLTDDSLAGLYGMPAEVEERGGWYRLW